MGMVTSVFWNCPGCGSREESQVDGRWDDPLEFPTDAIPSDRYLKSFDPCSNCGQYEMVRKRSFFEVVPQRVEKSDDEDDE